MTKYVNSISLRICTIYDTFDDIANLFDVCIVRLLANIFGFYTFIQLFVFATLSLFKFCTIFDDLVFLTNQLRRSFLNILFDIKKRTVKDLSFSMRFFILYAARFFIYLSRLWVLIPLRKRFVWRVLSYFLVLLRYSDCS